jgi:hypothetical protein
MVTREGGMRERMVDCKVESKGVTRDAGEYGEKKLMISGCNEVVSSYSLYNG